MIYLLHILFFLSGFAGLGYQIIWMRQLTLGMGHELPTLLALVTSFLGGVALGAWLLDKYTASSPRPQLWYMALECIIGFWGLVSLALIPLVNEFVIQVAGIETSLLFHWAIGFLTVFFALSPATLSMGATLSAMERLAAPFAARARIVGGLYAANTSGAAIGILTAAFALAPHLGYRASIAVFAITNLSCAILVGILYKRLSPSFQIKSPVLRKAKPRDRIFIALFLTGLLGIGLQVLCTRALSQILENTVYTYAILLVIYLIGIAAGASFYQRYYSHIQLERGLSFLLAALCVSCAISWAGLSLAGTLYARAWALFGQSQLSGFLGEAATAGAVFFIPAFFMGSTFSHLAQHAKDQVYGVGRALSLNTLGGALAPILFGALCLPLLGVKNTLALISLCYFAIIPGIRRRIVAFAPAALAILTLYLTPWNTLESSRESHVVAYREGVLASSAVLKKRDGSRSLKVNNKFDMGSTADFISERRKAHLALLLHPGPGRALFLGIGAGITLGTVKAYPNLSVDAVELDPDVIRLLPHFSPENGYPYGGQHRLHAGDSRRFIRSVSQLYDVIMADFFHPIRDGAGTLYTLEHFTAIRRRLHDGGLFCQWLPLYQLNVPVLQIIVKTFLEAFPCTRAYYGNFNAHTPGLALIGRTQKAFYDSSWYSRRVRDAGLRAVLQEEGLSDNYKLFTHFAATRRDLQAFSQSARHNTDNNPVVMYKAPGSYAQQSFTSHASLRYAVNLFKHASEDLILPNAMEENRGFLDNLEQALHARDLFLRGAMAQKEGDLETAEASYLKSAEISPFFTVGYATCLMLALKKHEFQPQQSRHILQELIRAQPQMEDAHVLMKKLFEN